MVLKFKSYTYTIYGNIHAPLIGTPWGEFYEDAQDFPALDVFKYPAKVDPVAIHHSIHDINSQEVSHEID